jgi:2-desacetyl-2-hydroxyethyl bacteriochlorophyllide A dehydrogenase
MNPTVVFTQPGKVILEDRPMPSPKAGELLIRTRRTLISTGTELTILRGEYPPDSVWSSYGKMPFVPGYDNIGEVIEVGEGVDRDWVGRRVATYGPHARFVTASAASARTIQREEVTDEHAAFGTLAEIVMNGVRRSHLQWGEAVAVYGAGLLGQLAARFCRLAGARPVCVIDIAESRLRRLPEDGSLLALNAAQGDAVAAVREATRGRMADVLIEVTGNPDVIPDELKLLKRQGRFVLLSSPRGKTLFDFHDLCNAPSFTIIGAHNSSHPRFETPEQPWTNKRHAELFFDLVADGEIDLAPLISHRERYTEAPRLYQALLEDRTTAMGVILDWDG